MRIIIITIAAICLFSSLPAYAQGDAGIKITPKQGELYHNTRNLNNPYIFPLWGKKLGERGFLLPYPIGIMLNGYISSQDVTISDLAVGINDNPMIQLDDVVGFSEVSANVQNMNFRTDLWVLPFLDVYGIFGTASVQTKVGIGSIMGKEVDYHTEADFNGYVYGVGAMLTGGIRSIFFSFDISKVWTHLDKLAHNNSAVNMGIRTGYVFHFQDNPQKNISVWTGVTRLFLSNTTEGTIDLNQVAPNFGDNYQNTDWYNALRPQVQSFVDDLVTKAQDRLDNSTIHYTLNKRPSHNYTMILGAQYQLNRHWQFRVETNFLGGRKSGLLSANYRFGLFSGQ